MESTLAHIDLFSGIGGFGLAARRAGLRTIQFCEIEPFCRAVLAKNFPGVPIDHDITKFNGKPFRGGVFLVTGGFPCQDISAAGKGAGLAGTRSGLWFELIRIIREIRPVVCLIENVPALRSRGADRVLQDLAEAGYTACAVVVGADDIGASHRRKRVWIVGYCQSIEGRVLLQQGRPFESNSDARGSGNRMAHTNTTGRFQRARTEPGGEELSSSECDCATVADSPDGRRHGSQFTHSGGSGIVRRTERQAGGYRCGMAEFPPGPAGDWSGIPPEFWPVEQAESGVCAVDDGISARLVRRGGDAGKRAAMLRGLGNAIVPQIAELFIRWAVEQFGAEQETTV